MDKLVYVGKCVMVPCYCQVCGLAIEDPGSVIIWARGNSKRHYFCDNDCLSVWMKERNFLVLNDFVA